MLARSPRSRGARPASIDLSRLNAQGVLTGIGVDSKHRDYTLGSSPVSVYNDEDKLLRRRSAGERLERIAYLALGCCATVVFLWWLFGSSSEDLALTRRLNRGACELSDPWREPGFVHANWTSPLHSGWTTVLPSVCDRHNHLANALNVDLSRNDDKLKGIVGKTIVVLGDEMDRQGIRHFCSLLAEDGLTRARDLRYRTSRGKNKATEQAGRMCISDRLNFRLAFFELESSAQADTASIYITGDDREARYATRLTDVVLPALKGGLEGRTVSLVVLSPGRRDLVTFGRQDELHAVALNSPLEALRMDALTRIIAALAKATQRVLPHTPVALRSLPRAVDPARVSSIFVQELAMTYVRAGKDHFSRFIQDIRVHQLRSALRSTAETRDLAFFDLSRVVNGYQMDDDELPLAPSGILYAQGLLHHLTAEQTPLAASRWSGGLTARLSQREIAARLAYLRERGGSAAKAGYEAVFAAVHSRRPTIAKD